MRCHHAMEQQAAHTPAITANFLSKALIIEVHQLNNEVNLQVAVTQ